MRCASRDSIGSLPRADSDWLVRVELDNARISSRISPSRSGGLGRMLIYVRDAADWKFCLLLGLFFGRRQESGSYRWVVSNPAGVGRLRFHLDAEVADEAVSFA